MDEHAAPVWDVNEWITEDPRWVSLLGDAGGDSRYPNIFYPVQQDPLGGIPYVRYTSTIYVPGGTYWYHQDEIMYAMYFSDVEHSNRAMNIIIDKVSAGDKSGAKLDQWRRGKGYDDFAYHSTEWVAGGSTQPSDERGGAHARLISFRVFYSPIEGTHIG